MPERVILGLALVLSVVISGVFLIDLADGGEQVTGEEIVGDELGCPDGSTVQSLFSLDGDEFRVIGPVTAVDESRVVVEGPTGEVAVSAEPPQTSFAAGDVVLAEGSVREQVIYVGESIGLACEAAAAPSAAPTDAATPAPPTAGAAEALPTEPVDEAVRTGECSGGAIGLELNEAEFKIEGGAVVDSYDGELIIGTPLGTVTVALTSSSDIEGDLGSAQEVDVEGDFSGDGSLEAEKIKVRCPDSAGDEDDVDDANNDRPGRPLDPGHRGHGNDDDDD